MADCVLRQKIPTTEKPLLSDDRDADTIEWSQRDEDTPNIPEIDVYASDENAV